MLAITVQTEDGRRHLRPTSEGLASLASGSPETTAFVGREVVVALEDAGLPTEWNGDPGSAITITPLDWRKRLV